MIVLHDITKQFGEHALFEAINLSIGTMSVSGLVGENGTGKTTLLKIIAGIITPDKGTVHREQEVIGYLPQNPVFPEGQIVQKFLESHISSADESYRIDIVLHEVGLGAVERNLEANRLSGGQKTKLYLASLLIADPQPTVLLLDEPTNNLDIIGISWLEEFLSSFNGTVLLTSHDRSLLDNVVDTILEIDDKKISLYGGNYSFYREQKELERQAYVRNYIAQQKKIQQIVEDIENTKERAKKGEIQFSSRMPFQRAKIRRSAQQAVHRQKKLEKFLASQQHLEKPDERSRLTIRLSGEVHRDKSILFAKHIQKTFNKTPVLKDVSFHMSGREHVWLSGYNGSGKTTLLKILTGQESYDGGTLEIGKNIRIGYFSQDRVDLDPRRTLLDELLTLHITQTEAYKLALRCNFTPDDLSKTIKSLSLGQQAKASFAKLLAGNFQLIILDEPTNHLEISTREVLEAGLADYNGALLVSSHDRFFLEQIGIDRILLLENGAITT